MLVTSSSTLIEFDTIMDNRWSCIKLFLVICIVGVVVAVEKRDVHHKIIVKTGRAPRSQLHHHHQHHHKNDGKHHHHFLQNDASFEDDSLSFESHEDTSKYQPHRHTPKPQPYKLDYRDFYSEPPLEVDFTPLVSTENQDDHHNHHHQYNKEHSNKHKKRHNNHRNRYDEERKFPKIDLTTNRPTFYETNNFPSFDDFKSYNQKILNLNQSPFLSTKGFAITPELLNVNDATNTYEVKEDINDDVNGKNQTTLQILAPIFMTEESIRDEKTIKTTETTTRRPSVRTRGNVRVRKNPK